MKSEKPCYRSMMTGTADILPCALGGSRRRRTRSSQFLVLKQQCKTVLLTSRESIDVHGGGPEQGHLHHFELVQEPVVGEDLRTRARDLLEGCKEGEVVSLH